MIKYHQMIAYIRLNYNEKGILYSKLPDEFNPFIIYHFSQKFPLFCIMLEHKGKTYIMKHSDRLKIIDKSIENAIDEYESSLKNAFDFSGDFEKIWGNFYDSQYIKERKNKKLFHKFIPKRLQKLGILQKEFDGLNKNKKLNEMN